MIKMNQAEINPNRLTSEKYYPVFKIVSLVIAFIAAAFMLYYAAETAKSHLEAIKEINEQIKEIKLYEAQGAEIPAEYKAQFNLPVAYYLALIFNFVFALLPLAGALLPNKYSKASILLISAPIAFCFHNILVTVAYIIMKVNLKLVLSDILLNTAGILLIISAIFLLFTKKKAVIANEDEFNSNMGYSYIPEDLEYEDYNEFTPDEEPEVEIEITVDDEESEIVADNEESTETPADDEEVTEA